MDNNNLNELRWCTTCLQWKEALQKNNRKFNSIQWKHTKSWTWPAAMENIIEVFAKDHNLRDIANTCSIWKKCNAFNINPFVLDRISDLRNKHYGHNPYMKVSDLDKTRVFDALNDLVKDREVIRYVDARTCIEELKTIENGDEMEKYKAVIEPLKVNMELIMRKIDEIQNKPGVIDSSTTIIDRNKFKKQTIGSTILFVMTLICCSYIQQDIRMVIHHVVTEGFSFSIGPSNADCVSEKYTHPFPQDLPLFPYIADHKPLIGRKWLFEEIEQKLFHTKQDRHGLSVVAEMGYGKSALVSHMLCAKHNANGWNLRDNIAAFHVCKFDVYSTMNAGRFIRRLVGFFSTYSAQFGHQIALLDMHSLIFDEEQCGKDPVACLDQGVLFPLKEVNGEKTWLVVIDALDECFDSNTDTNHLLDLLKIRIKKFPYWIKFLIFSRDIPGITDLNTLTELRLISSDQRNLNDIEIYLDIHYTLIDRMKDYFGTTSDLEVIKEILKESEGNFLFVAFSLEYIMDRYSDYPSLSLPRNLPDFYESNFKRQFQSITAFKSAKLILQIVCASLIPLAKSDIMNVLHSNNFTDDNLIEHSFNKLSFFLRIQKEVTFLHQSIHDWLLSKENEKFKIQQEQGHEYLSKYLFEATQINQTMDVIEMAIHAGKSEKREIREIFQSLKHEYLEPKSLHRLVSLTDSGWALELVLPYVTDIDPLDDNRQTPAFVAASKGHSKQLKLFFAKGANISFTTQYVSYEYDGSFLENIFQMIETIKTKYFSGYNLLHIAVLNKHIHVVRYLLTIDSALIYLRNAIGHLPSDIACECGYTEILQEIAALNHSIVGETCIYLAAKHGHGTVIDFVNQTHTACECISDNTAILSYNTIMKSPLNSSSKHLDEWWKVFKESALHVAVRNGHYSVVEKLSRHFTHLLNCTDAFGRTPFLASIWYNQTRMFILLNFRLSETIEICSGSLSHISDNQLLEEFILKRNCQDGFSIAHLLARFDRSEMIHYIKQNELPLNWILLDNGGLPAEHYAACYASISYLRALRDGYIPAYSSDDRRYKNGMTIYHSAAMCGRNESLLILNPLYLFMSFPQFVDEKGRGILLYSALNRLEKSSPEIQYEFATVVHVLVTSGHSLVQNDSDGRNILHYAMLNGYYFISMYMYFHDKFTWYGLHEQKDVIGKTPIEYSLSANVVQSYTYFKLPQQCLFFNVFYKRCTPVNIEELMSPWEMTIIQSVIIFYENDFGHSIPGNIIPTIYMNSPYVTTAMIHYLNKTDSDLRWYLLRTMSRKLPPNNLFQYSLVALAGLRPDVLLVCNQPFEMSPLHKLAYDKDIYFVDEVQMDMIVNLLFKLRSVQSCPDSKGFSILHYSILGEKRAVAGVHMHYGDHVTNKQIRYTDILWMTLFPWREHYFSWNKLYQDDSVVSEYISLHFLQLKHSDFCLNDKKELSLIHLLSLKGMASTLKVIKDIYGPDILLCTTRNGFTPYYMWRIFNSEVLWDTRVEMPLDVILPDDVTENVLLHKMLGLYNEKLGCIDPLKCLLEIKAIHWKMGYIRKKYKIIKCLAESTKCPYIFQLFKYERKQYFGFFYLIYNAEQFLEGTLFVELLLEKEFPNCSAVADFLNKRRHFIIEFMQIFNDDTSKIVSQYLINEFTDFKNRNMCPLSNHNIYRLKNILSATNHFVSRALPRLINMCAIHAFFVNKFDLVFDANEFLRERLHHHTMKFVPLLKNKTNHFQTFALLRVYKDFRYLDILEKILNHKCGHRFTHVP